MIHFSRLKACYSVNVKTCHMENILANILKQELVYATMERQWQELGLGNTSGRLAFYLIKSTVTRRDSHVIHKTENLLDVIYDNFDCPLFVAKYHPAEYSSEYSAGRKFASKIFGWKNTFTYKAENNAL